MGNPYNQYSALLLPLYGEEGGTVIDDKSPRGIDPTKYGTIYTTEAQSKWYGSSAYVDPDSYLTVPGVSGLDDFCFEGWFYFVPSGQSQIYARPLVAIERSYTYAIQLRVNLGSIDLYLYSYEYDRQYSYNAAVSITPNTWHHIYVSRYSPNNNFFVVVNGQLVLDVYPSRTITFDTGSIILFGTESIYSFGPGYAQDVRFVAGSTVYWPFGGGYAGPPAALYDIPANAYFSATEDIGEFYGVAGELGDCFFVFDNDIGDFKALADPYVYRARLSSNSDLGNLETLAYPVTQGFFDTTMTNDLGAFKAVGSVPVDEWASAGFPCPTRTRFSYIQGPGLVRTTFEAGNTWQRRRWTNNYRECEVGFRMSRDLLPAVETFLDARGYDWFQMGLTTGAYDQRASVPTRVRVKENPKLSGVGDGMFELTLTLEVDGTL